MIIETIPWGNIRSVFSWLIGGQTERQRGSKVMRIGPRDFLEADWISFSVLASSWSPFSKFASSSKGMKEQRMCDRRDKSTLRFSVTRIWCISKMPASFLRHWQYNMIYSRVSCGSTEIFRYCLSNFAWKLISDITPTVFFSFIIFFILQGEISETMKLYMIFILEGPKANMRLLIWYKYGSDTLINNIWSQTW